MGDSIVIQFRNLPEYESVERTIVSLPNVVRLGVESSVWLRQSAFEPPGESQAVSLDLELETPLDPVRFGKVETEVGQPGTVRHVAFTDGDVTSRCRIGIRNCKGVGI